MYSRLIKYLLFMLAIATPVAAGLFCVWVNQDSVQIGYELSEQTKRKTKLLALKKKLELELSTERSPKNLTSLSQKHGLHAPLPQNVLGPSKAIRGRNGH